jgi:CubicO group peptidase (beta-lactamase class C family)
MKHTSARLVSIHASCLFARTSARLLVATAGLAVLGSSLAPQADAAERATEVAAVKPELKGKWTGVVKLPGTALEFVLNFASDAEGTISIPAQKVEGFVLENIAIDAAASPATATFRIKEVPGAIGGNPTFKGTFNAEGTAIAGEFSQGAAKFPFEIKRGDAAASAAAALDGFDGEVDKIREAWQVPGIAIAIVKGGEIIYAKGFGFRDLDKKLPVSENTLFPIGSSTKAFTTFVLASLAEEGKFDWDKPVTTYLPSFRLYDRVLTERMTGRDLVTHRSGLPRHDLVWYGVPNLPRAELVKRLPYLENNKDLREKWQYNNLMFLTAGVVGETLTGKTWEQNVRERILTPLGMNRSNFTIADMTKDADYSLGYREAEDTFKVERMDFREMVNMGPAGSINSSVKEMANWVMLHLSNGQLARSFPGPAAGKRLLQADALKDMHAPHMTRGDGNPETPEIVPVGYGLGWFIDVYRGRRVVHHGGNIDGFSSLVAMLPQENLGVVVLTNMNGTPTRDLLVRYAVDRLLGLEPSDWSDKAIAKRDLARSQGKEAKSKLDETKKPNAPHTHPLAEYAGEYHHPGYGTLVVNSTSDGALSFTYNNITTGLGHWHYDVFKGTKNAADQTYDSFTLQFGTGFDGEIDSVRGTFEPSVGPISFQRQGDAELKDKAFLAKLAGDYLIMGTQPCTITLTDATLTASIPGQPTFELIPARGRTFKLKGLEGFSVQFVLEGDAVTELKFLQPNGVFTGKPVKK